MTSAFSESALANLTGAFQLAVDDGLIPGAVLLLDVAGETWVQAVGCRDVETHTPMTADTIFRIASMTKPILATAAMILVEDGLLELDAPVDRWLPEFAHRRVLRHAGAPLADTIPADRAITLRDLLTNQWGLGALFADSPTALQSAMEDAGVAPGYLPPSMPPDDWIRALAALPLAFQPGEGWLYHTGFDVLALLLTRVAGVPVSELLRARIFEPLGMPDTAYQVPAGTVDRLATCYASGREPGRFTIVDPGRDGEWSRPPLFPSEVVSTAADYLAFARMLRSRGDSPGGRILAPSSVDLMIRDHVPGDVKQRFPFFPGFWNTTGWGFGVSVVTQPGPEPGPPLSTYGWSGGFHTHWMNDPVNDLTGLLLMQLQSDGPEQSGLPGAFWRLAYAAIAT